MNARLRLPIVVATLIALAGAGAAATVSLGSGAVRIATHPSPDGRERVELVGRTRWQRLAHPGGDLLGTVRLIGAHGQVLTTSPLLELSGEGEVFWTPTGIQIGSSAIYDRRADKWTVTQ